MLRGRPSSCRRRVDSLKGEIELREGITTPLSRSPHAYPGRGREFGETEPSARRSRAQRADAATFPPFNSGGGEPPRHGRADADGAGHLSEGPAPGQDGHPPTRPRAERAARGAAKPKPTGHRPARTRTRRGAGGGAPRDRFIGHQRGQRPGSGGIIPRPRCTATSPARTYRRRTRCRPGRTPSATNTARRSGVRGRSRDTERTG